MAVSKEIAIEMALGTNGLMLTNEMLKRGMQELAALQMIATQPESRPHLNKLAEILMKSKDTVNVLMDRYNVELGKVTDETPDVKDEVIASLKGHDVITAIELVVRMNAADRAEQLRLRGQ